MDGLRRRELLQAAGLAAGALALGPSFWRQALAGEPARVGPGPYGPLGAADANGIRLPAGFSSRVVARAGQPVPGTAYPWHAFPDGMATYSLPGGGFVLVSNSEVPGGGQFRQGGASAIRFGPAGEIESAYRILGGTRQNCAGGATPWGTWLSCEEVDDGLVWECDPLGEQAAVVRPALGSFSHEAVCVDPVHRQLYLTEDATPAGFYRFTPDHYPDLAAGQLEIAVVAGDGKVTWRPVPAGGGSPVARVPGATKFLRGEGVFFDDGVVYQATTSDDRLWAYHTSEGVMEIVYDGKALGDAAPLHDPDNVIVHGPSGDIYVGEDADDLNVCILTRDGEISPFLQLTGEMHTRSDSEVTGPIFDPSGRRFFFSSQRAFGLGVVYEVTGPFRMRRSGDTRRPRARIVVLGPGTTGAFRREGLPLRVAASEATRIQARLTARDGKRTVVLARGAAEVPPFGGEAAVTLVPTAAGKRLARSRRQLRGTVRAVVTDSAGNRRVVRRAVRLRR